MNNIENGANKSIWHRPVGRGALLKAAAGISFGVGAAAIESSLTKISQAEAGGTCESGMRIGEGPNLPADIVVEDGKGHVLDQFHWDGHSGQSKNYFIVPNFQINGAPAHREVWHTTVAPDIQKVSDSLCGKRSIDSLDTRQVVVASTPVLIQTPVPNIKETPSPHVQVGTDFKWLPAAILAGFLGGALIHGLLSRRNVNINIGPDGRPLVTPPPPGPEPHRPVTVPNMPPAPPGYEYRWEERRGLFGRPRPTLVTAPIIPAQPQPRPTEATPAQPAPAPQRQEATPDQQPAAPADNEAARRRLIREEAERLIEERERQQAPMRQQEEEQRIQQALDNQRRQFSEQLRDAIQQADQQPAQAQRGQGVGRQPAQPPQERQAPARGGQQIRITVPPGVDANHMDVNIRTGTEREGGAVQEQSQPTQ